MFNSQSTPVASRRQHLTFQILPGSFLEHFHKQNKPKPSQTTPSPVTQYSITCNCAPRPQPTQGTRASQTAGAFTDKAFTDKLSAIYARSLNSRPVRNSPPFLNSRPSRLAHPRRHHPQNLQPQITNQNRSSRGDSAVITKTWSNRRPTWSRARLRARHLHPPLFSRTCPPS